MLTVLNLRVFSCNSCILRSAKRFQSCCRLPAGSLQQLLERGTFSFGASQQHTYTGRALNTTIMAEAIDLTLADSEDEMQPETHSQEEEARKRIMDFARNKAAAKRLKASDEGLAADAPLPKPDQLQQQGAAAAAAAEVAAGSSVDNPTASLLRELHEARMRRQQAKIDANAADAAGPIPSIPAGAAAAAAGEAADSGPASTDAAAVCRPEFPVPRQSAQAAAAPASEDPPSAPAQPSDGLASRSKQAGPSAAAAGPAGNKGITLLTYNVWFREDLALLERMMAIGDIITQAGYPTFICLQEVTPFIMELFLQMPWSQHYTCNPPPADAPYFTLLLVNNTAVPGTTPDSFRERLFGNSVMGRSLRTIRVEVAGQPVIVATSHLESPIPPQRWYSSERQQQMGSSLQQLEASGVGNVLFAGDMNWEDKRDGSPPLPPGWLDAWQQLQPGRPGFTYDANNNPMLAYKGLGLRLDRIFCKLKDWRLKSVQMLGTEPLPGVHYTHTFRNGGSKQLPVLPSDHFGLLLQLEEA